MDGSAQRFPRMGPSTVSYSAAAISGADLSFAFLPASVAFRVGLGCLARCCVPQRAVCDDPLCWRRRPPGWLCTFCARIRCVRDRTRVPGCVCLCLSACVCVRVCVRVSLLGRALGPPTAGRAHSAGVSCTVSLAQGDLLRGGEARLRGPGAAPSAFPHPRASVRPRSRGGPSHSQWHRARGRD